jgi:hypothetical protein
MSYGLDPQIDERLARLVEGLPSRSAPSIASFGALRPYRTPRLVLVLVAAVLVLLAALAWIWLTHGA